MIEMLDKPSTDVFEARPWVFIRILGIIGASRDAMVLMCESILST